MADGNIIPLRTAREVAWKAGLRVVEQSPAGTHGFPAPEALTVDLDGNRVLINGVRAKTFMSETSAIRSAAALQTLAELGWPIERLIECGPRNPEAA